MPSFDINRLQSISGISPASSAVADADRANARPATDKGASSLSSAVGRSTSSAGVAVEVAAPAQDGPPVDNDRVAEIRNALREGTYPLVPAKIADAMIAAQYSFESEE